MEFGVRHANGGETLHPLSPSAGPLYPAGNRAQVGIGSANLPPVRKVCKPCGRFMGGDRRSDRVSHGTCWRCLEALYPAEVAAVRASCPHETHEVIEIKPLYEGLDIEIRTVRCEDCGHKWDLEPSFADEDGGR